MHIFFFIFFLLLSAFSFSQQSKIDSLLALLQKDKPDTNKVIHLNRLCWEYSTAGNNTAALQNGNASLQLSNLLGFKRGIANAYNNIGIVYDDQGNYGEALENYFASLKMQEAIGDKRGQAGSYNNIGLVYYHQGKADKALNNYLASLKLYEEVGYRKGIAIDYNNIGLIYSDQGNYAKALENHLASLKIRQETGDQRGIADSYTNIGLIYFNQGNYDKALENHLAARKMKEEVGDKQGIASSYNNIGEVYRKKGNTDRALENYSLSLGIFEEIGDKYNVANSCNTIATVYMDRSEYSRAIIWGKKGMLLAKEIGASQLLVNSYTGLSEAGEKTGDYKNAYTYFKEAMILQDTLFSQENRKQLTRKEMDYEFMQKESVAKMEQQKKDALVAEEKKKQTVVIYSVSTGLVLTLLLAVFIVFGYRQRISSNALLALNKEELSRQNAMLHGQEEERKRIAEELHDGIGGTLAAIKLNLLRINTTSQNVPGLEAVITTVDNTCEEVRTISHNLMPPALVNNLFTDVMKDLVRKFIAQDKLKIELDCFPEQELNHAPENIQLDMYRILQELINNVVKHAKADLVTIQLSIHERAMLLLVEDNGKGFDLSSGVAGIGLKNIRSRVSLHKGKIEMDSKPGRGTVVDIHIPL
jgi:signal transduction histidine kinase